MSKLMVDLSISLDGFIAGANDGVDNPLGDGGEALFAWMGAGPERNRVDRWLCPPDPSKQIVEEWMTEAGAMISGRRTFDIAGGWKDGHPVDVANFVRHPRAAGERRVEPTRAVRQRRSPTSSRARPRRSRRPHSVGLRGQRHPAAAARRVARRDQPEHRAGAARRRRPAPRGDRPYRPRASPRDRISRRDARALSRQTLILSGTTRDGPLGRPLTSTSSTPLTPRT